MERENLRKICYEKARSIYGDPLPELIEARLEKEMKLITEKIDSEYMSMLEMLEDMTGIKYKNIPLDDQEIYSIFNSCEALDIKTDDYEERYGTCGIPEFETDFAVNILADISPKKFSDLIRIPALAHGTGLWLGNAQKFIKSGQATVDDIIATQDDIMNYLADKGISVTDSFEIMESVRKGQGLKPEWEECMRKNGVPEWYIESCSLAGYIFPKANAVSAALMAYRTAFYKLHYPLEFYAAYFTVWSDMFDMEKISAGIQPVKEYIAARAKKQADVNSREYREYLVCKTAYEMYARGYEFIPAAAGKSDIEAFKVENGKIRLPLKAIK